MIGIVGWLVVVAGGVGMDGDRMDHSVLDGLLEEYVHGSRVDYAGLKKRRSELESYVRGLGDVDVKGLSRNERMALFINAYNACTLSLIVEHLGTGLKSIMRIPEEKRWKDKRWVIGGKTYSLDEIEHSVLRSQFGDARVHAAINCASVGCPDLRAEAFAAEQLDRQLDEQFARFVNDPRHVRVTDDGLQVSSIFDWFKNDFTKDGRSVLWWIQRYADDDLEARLKRLGKSPKIGFLKYDWSLNGMD